MEETYQISVSSIGKAQIDCSPPGLITISVDDPVRVDPVLFRQEFAPVLKRIKGERSLIITPLRHILLTSKIRNAVVNWQVALGLPQAGVSEQPEGAAVAKT